MKILNEEALFQSKNQRINFILIMKEFISNLGFSFQLNEKQECHSLPLVSEPNGTISNFENEIE